MLQNLRDKAQGWIAWVIVGLIGTTFVLFGTGSMFSDNVGKKVVANINGTKITNHQLEMTYQRFLRQPGNEALNTLDANSIKKELLQSLIDDAIMYQAALKLGLNVSNNHIQATLDQLPFLQKEGRFSQQAYHHFLSSANYTDSEFRALIRDSLIKQQLQQGVKQTDFSLPEDVSTLVKYILQKRDIRYVTISRASFEKDVTVAEDEIKKYYETHLNDFQTQEQVSLEYIHLSLKDLMKKHLPSSEDMKLFYKENSTMFSEPKRIHVAHILVALPKNAETQAVEKAQAKLKEIEQKLKSGESFESLAKKYSDDKGSAPAGGILEWFSNNEMVPEFSKAAFSLEKNGQVSQPIRSEFGLHLIKLLGIQSEKVQPFESVKEQIIQKLQQQKAEDEFASMADDLNALSFDHPDSLQPARDKLGLPVLKTDLFTKGQLPKDPLLQNQAVINAIYSPSVKEDKNNSDLIKLDNENYIVLRIEKEIPAKQKALVDVSQDIKNILINQKAELLAKKQAEDLENKFIKSKSAELSWKEKLGVTRSSNDLEADLIEGVFTMPRPNKDKPELKVVRLNNGDYALIWLVQVTDGNYQQLSLQEKKNYQDSLTRHMGELDFALYAQDLIHKAKIKKDID